MEKFKSCGKCNNGYYYRKDDKGEIVVIPCKCLLEYKHKVKIKTFLVKANLPPSIYNYSIDSYIGNNLKNDLEKFKKYIAEFRGKFYNINLYFWSKESSTQKTTIASWIGKSLIEEGITYVRFILMNDLIKLLQNADFKEEAEKKVNDLINSDFLIIDDAFDPTKVTVYKSGYQLSFLDSFLRKRIEQINKAICFTSNIPIEDIKILFSKSIQELIKRSVIPFHFVDRIDYNVSYTIFDD